MAYRVGETFYYTITTGSDTETFDIIESRINGVDDGWEPTWTSLGDGGWEASYLIADIGAHSWRGDSSAGIVTINFDVDPVTETVIAVPAVQTISANQSIGGAGGPRPAIIENLVIYQGEHWYWPMQLISDDGTITDTTGWNAQMTVRATAEGGQALFASVNNGRMFVGYDPPKRTSSTAYSLGSFVVPNTGGLNGYVYKATVAGTSHSSPPTWPTTIGQTVTDGTVTWTCVYTDAEYVTNLRVELQPTDTDDVAEWNVGRFDIEVTDLYAKQTRIVEGNTVLSRAMTRPAS